MAEQVGLALFFGPEPSGHGLRRRVFVVDAVDDLIKLEGRESPVDRRPRRFDSIALAAEIAGNTPADFKARPARRKPRPDPSSESSACFFLDHEHAHAMQRPMPGHDGRVPPPDQLVGYGLAISGDESRGTGIGQHRGVWRDVGAAPSTQLQALGLDDGAVGLSKCHALLERSNHRYFHSSRTNTCRSGSKGGAYHPRKVRLAIGLGKQQHAGGELAVMNDSFVRIAGSEQYLQ